MLPATLFERASEAVAAGRYRRAVQLCGLALNARPEPELAAQLRLARAEALIELGETGRAERDCRRALERVPSARAHVLLERCHFEQGRYGEAASELETALGLDPDAACAWRLHSRVLSKLGRHEEALQSVRAGIGDDASPGAQRALAETLAAAGRHAELVELLQAELAKRPDDGDLWAMLGLSYNALGRSDEAVPALREALERNPVRTDVNFGLGVALLRLGNIDEGFRYYQHRQKDPAGIPRFGVKAWCGEPLAGKHLLVLSEQGFGDILQFARFVPKVRNLAERVSFLVPPPLARLLRSSAELDVVLTSHPGFGSADYQALLLSLPHLLGTAAGLALRELPLLSPEPELVAKWSARLPSGPKIAIAWQGNPKYAGEPWRSMPFAQYSPLFERYGESVYWLSLQKHFGREQLTSLEPRPCVLDLGSEIDAHGAAFVDSLAILSLVDLFITTDTALAHLAGSAGIRTWLLLSHVADWRWGISAETSIWYPSVRLFRQSTWDDWPGVIRRVGAAMEAFLPLAASHAARQSGSKSIARCSIPPHVVGTGS